MNLSSAAAQRQHYATIRARLWPVVVPPIVIGPIEAAVIYRRRIGPHVPRQGLLIYSSPIGPGQTSVYLVSRNPFHTAELARRIVDEVATKHGFTPEELFARRRQNALVVARHEVMWRLKREATAWSLPQIGRYLGGMDHTSVLHGVRRHQERLDAGTAL
jgi:hypothetical protein